MRKINYSALWLLLLLIPFSVIGQEEKEKQEEAQERPLYLVLTTQHFNSNKENFSMKEWKELQKEYVDKVLSKNDHIVDGGVYTHYMGPDSREVVHTAIYKDWAAIDAASERNGELASEAWTDEKARDEFFQKMNSYYEPKHSDEIYYTISFAKPIPPDDLKSDKVVLLQKREFKPFGTWEEGDGDALESYVKNVVHKNEYVKGYYPARHAWGSDSTEFIEAIYLDSMDDVEKMFNKNDELEAAYLDNEEKKKDLSTRMNRMFGPKHQDYVYAMVPELRVRQ